MKTLPVEEVRVSLLAALEDGPVVLTAPTGTGKSTQVPRWVAGRVLMVQPRRVACRAVASRIAELEGVPLGGRVGYRVRDDNQSSRDTEVLVVTPGIILSQPSLLEDFDIVILDEFHERRLDTDLILALLLDRGSPFITMSATMDGQRVASHVGGKHLEVKARTFSVQQLYSGAGAELPEAKGLESRVVQALNELSPLDGDALVFLPGKSEIAATEKALSRAGFTVQVLHGGLNLREQARVLRQSEERRVILSTNVAETSVTIPGVRVVVDSGLVRRTTYYGGRSYLSLMSIAQDSAEQRAGRAGRTAPGICMRLWGRRAQLDTVTPPEIHRESLVPLLMTAASLGVRAERLPFLDAPKVFSLEDARERLVELGAIERDERGVDALTERGKALCDLPLDPWLSRILVEAEQTGALCEAIDLVAALEQGQARFFAETIKRQELDVVGCDAALLVTAVRRGQASSGSLVFALKEARSTASRLRRAFGIKASSHNEEKFSITLYERERLIRTILRADPSCAHIARRRKNRLVFAGGGAELTLARESRVQPLVELEEAGGKSVDALVVLGSRAIASGRQRHLMATFASAVPLQWLADAELGELRVVRTGFSKKDRHPRRLVSSIERTFAGRVIEKTEKEPQGGLAREAIVQLFLQGRLYPKSLKAAKYRLARRGLAARLGASAEESFFNDFPAPPLLADWLLHKLEEWGVESGEDLELLSDEDFVPEGVPAELAPQLNEQFPDQVDLGDCLYKVDYKLEEHQVLLSVVRGGRKKPPPANYLPRFAGFSVFVEAGGSFHPLRR